MPTNANSARPGFKQRKTLYNLYHELNHFNLFGGGYASSAQSSINQLVHTVDENQSQPIEFLSADRIAERLHALAQDINQHYEHRDILLVSILDGAIIFTADLLRLLKVPTQLDCLRISSYGDSTSPESPPVLPVV